MNVSIMADLMIQNDWEEMVGPRSGLHLAPPFGLAKETNCVRGALGQTLPVVCMFPGSIMSLC